MWETGGGLKAWLGCVEACATQFCSTAQTDGHELTELLQNYWRCRRQLTQSHTQLHTQSSDCKSTQNRLWSFRDEQLTLQVGPAPLGGDHDEHAAINPPPLSRQDISTDLYGLKLHKCSKKFENIVRF